MKYPGSDNNASDDNSRFLVVATAISTMLNCGVVGIFAVPIALVVSLVAGGVLLVSR